MLIGWFNHIQKGYLHLDISIGNLVMVEDALTTEAFGILKKEDWNATVEDITQALQDLTSIPLKRLLGRINLLILCMT
jgi:hypothetical protein